MVVTDRLTKSVVYEAMKDTTAEHVARKLIDIVFRHHGLPSAIVSDRGSQFASHVMKVVCHCWGINSGCLQRGTLRPTAQRNEPTKRPKHICVYSPTLSRATGPINYRQP